MEPITREEKYLAAMTGANITPPAPVTRHEMYLAAILNKLGEGATGGVSSWNDLTDKPFYETKTEILPQGDVTFVFDETYNSSVLTVDLPAPLSLNEKIEVTWEGTTYLCTQFMLDLNTVVFGNLSFIGSEGDTGEPFIGLVNGSQLVLIDSTVQTDVVRNVSISEVSVTTLPSKYVGFTITRYYCRAFSDGQYLYADHQLTRKVTKAELSEAIRMGIVTATIPAVNVYVTAYHAYCDVAQVYGEASFITMNNNHVKLYTAEYTTT